MEHSGRQNYREEKQNGVPGITDGGCGWVEPERGRIRQILVVMTLCLDCDGYIYSCGLYQSLLEKGTILTL